MSSISSATIIRAKHSTENPYFQMLRKTAQDENLSWEARGVVAYLLSKPDNWEIQVKDLQQQCGRDKVYKIMKDLIDAGYIEDRVKYKDDKGHIKYTPYKLHETPRKSKIIKLETTETPTVQEENETDNKPNDNPLPENPYTGKPYTDKPYTENTDIYIEEKEQKKEEHKKDDKEKAQSSDLSELSKAYESNMGLITPMIRDELCDWLSDYPLRWCLDAIATAVKAEKRSAKYTLGILKNWKREGKKDGLKQDTPSPAHPSHRPAQLDTQQEQAPEVVAANLAMLDDLDAVEPSMEESA